MRPIGYRQSSRRGAWDLRQAVRMPLKSLVARCDKLANLAPLAGMKLETLDLEYTAVEDITPLQGMPLRTLNMGTCKKLHDLSPLAGVGLTSTVLPPPRPRKSRRSAT